VTPQGSAVFDTLVRLAQAKVPITVEHIISDGNSRNAWITRENLETVIFTTEYSVGAFEYYKERLRGDWARFQLEVTLTTKLLPKLTEKGDINTDLLLTFVDDIQENVSILKGTEHRLITPGKFVSDYLEMIGRRNLGTELYETGDAELDAMLTMGFAPGDQTGLFGDTGMGKSMVSLNWINKQINKQIPGLAIMLEMTRTSTADRLFALRNNIVVKQLVPQVRGESLDSFIMDLLEAERKRFEKMNSYMFVDETNLFISDVETLVKDAKRKMGVDYLVCTIDLWSMLKDVAGLDPGDYEEGMNKTLEVAKRQHVHFIDVIQKKREGFKAPPTIEGLQRFRPTKDSIKNSGAIAERCRNLFSVYREKYYAEEFFPEDPETIAMDDIVEVQNLKQTQGKKGGFIRYLHHPGMFKLSRISPEEIEENYQRREIAAETRPQRQRVRVEQQPEFQTN
jgi:replicative DNA helicase